MGQGWHMLRRAGELGIEVESVVGPVPFALDCGHPFHVVQDHVAGRVIEHPLIETAQVAAHGEGQAVFQMTQRVPGRYCKGVLDNLTTQPLIQQIPELLPSLQFAPTHFSDRFQRCAHFRKLGYVSIPDQQERYLGLKLVELRFRIVYLLAQHSVLGLVNLDVNARPK